MTIVDLFWDRTRRLPDAVALRHHVDGEWMPVTWAEYGTAVAEVAAGLVDLGVAVGDRVGILSANEVRWHQADVGILSAAAVSVPAYPTSASGQVAHVFGHSGCRVCFVANTDQLAKVLLHRQELPGLATIVVFDSVPDGLGDSSIISFDDLRARGRDRLAVEPEVVRERVAVVDDDALATIVYTSGTTGAPKGAMLSHGNLRATIDGITAMVPIGPDDRFLSFLPLSHIAERIVSHFGQIVAGGETWFARSLSTAADDLRACQPTIFFAVPRVWEKLQAAIRNHIASLSGVALRLGTDYLALVASRPEGTTARDQARRAIWELRFAALDRIVGHRIRQESGLGRARVLVSGAAPVEPALLAWFHGIGLPVGEVYGQTEDCGPTSFNPPGRIRIGSVGLPLPGVEVRIAGDGEILVRGATVCQGYFNDPERTAELIDDQRWMHSGDLGRLDADGYLYVTGRKKDLIITSSGKNIAPQALEAKLQAEPLVAQAVVVGDGRPYLTALLGLDTEAVAGWAHERGKVASAESLASDPDLLAEVADCVGRMNVEHAPIEQIKAWRVIPAELTIAADELTPTLKVRRDVVNEHYSELIEELYAVA